MQNAESARPFWRQGDIYFVKVDEKLNLDQLTVVKSGIIARGETSGHMHRLSHSSMVDGAVLMSFGNSMYLSTHEKGATIVHDEHGPIELPHGAYAVVHQQEFDGLRWRAVID